MHSPPHTHRAPHTNPNIHKHTHTHGTIKQGSGHVFPMQRNKQKHKNQPLFSHPHAYTDGNTHTRSYTQSRSQLQTPAHNSQARQTAAHKLCSWRHTGNCNTVKSVHTNTNTCSTNGLKTIKNAFRNIAPHILSLIFEYLDSTSLRRCSLVNTEFNGVAKDGALWEPLARTLFGMKDVSVYHDGIVMCTCESDEKQEQKDPYGYCNVFFKTPYSNYLISQRANEIYVKTLLYELKRVSTFLLVVGHFHEPYTWELGYKINSFQSVAFGVEKDASNLPDDWSLLRDHIDSLSLYAVIETSEVDIHPNAPRIFDIVSYNGKQCVCVFSQVNPYHDPRSSPHVPGLEYFKTNMASQSGFNCQHTTSLDLFSPRHRRDRNAFNVHGLDENETLSISLSLSLSYLADIFRAIFAPSSVDIGNTRRAGDLHAANYEIPWNPHLENTPNDLTLSNNMHAYHQPPSHTNSHTQIYTDTHAHTYPDPQNTNTVMGYAYSNTEQQQHVMFDAPPPPPPTHTHTHTHTRTRTSGRTYNIYPQSNIPPPPPVLPPHPCVGTIPPGFLSPLGPNNLFLTTPVNDIQMMQSFLLSLLPLQLHLILHIRPDNPLPNESIDAGTKTQQWHLTLQADSVNDVPNKLWVPKTIVPLPKCSNTNRSGNDSLYMKAAVDFMHPGFVFDVDRKGNISFKVTDVAHDFEVPENHDNIKLSAEVCDPHGELLFYLPVSSSARGNPNAQWENSLKSEKRYLFETCIQPRLPSHGSLENHPIWNGMVFTPHANTVTLSTTSQADENSTKRTVVSITLSLNPVEIVHHLGEKALLIAAAASSVVRQFM